VHQRLAGGHDRDRVEELLGPGVHEQKPARSRPERPDPVADLGDDLDGWRRRTAHSKSVCYNRWVTTADSSQELRAAAMSWLDRRPSPRVDFGWLSGFEYDGQRIPLMDRQRGIRKPAGMDAALAIRTTFTPPNQLPPYNDAIGSDGLQRYKYRGDDPHHPENVALRRAFEQRLPLIWFVGVASGLYEPIYPVWVVGDDAERLEFALALDEGQRFVTPGTIVDEESRRYVERLTKQRLHQRVFRSQVLLAYGGRCAICKIRHTELLDAAHIIADGKPRGEPSLTV
jgi:putative restriction endonuclease